MRLIASLLAALTAAPALANGQPIADAFATEHARAPQYALGLAYSAPGLRDMHTAGPIHKGTSEQVSQDGLWHIGSITKSFTATLVMQQVERGTIDLDAPVGGYVTADMHPAWQALTMRQILSHTAGLRRDPRAMQVLGIIPGTPSEARRTVLESFWTEPTKTAPGPHVYSNLGYLLAGVVLEDVTGITWEELVQRDIAVPLGLETLGFGAPQNGGNAWGHRNLILTRSPVDPSSPKSDNPAWLGPAGTLHMSLDDLLTWGEAQLSACKGNSKLISAKSCQTMIERTAPEYGFGWVIGEDIVWHNGSNTMWYAQLMLHPSTGSVVAVTQNTVRGREMSAFATRILNALINDQQ